MVNKRYEKYKNSYKKYKNSYKKYREKNREKAREVKKEYYKLHKNECIQQSTDWNFEKAFGGLRDEVLERDNWECVNCGMSSEQHLIIFGRRITLDHIDGNRDNNELDNLQTLCLRCHGSKDRRRWLSK